MKKDPVVPNDSRTRASAADEAIARLLRAGARDGRDVPGPDCLDAEELAAWTSGRLTAERTAVVEMHLSSCARCQAGLGLLAQLEPPRSAVPVDSWWRRWRLAWMLPATATASALLVWAIWPPPPVPAPAATDARLEPQRVIVSPEPEIPTVGAPATPGISAVPMRSARAEPQGQLGERTRPAPAGGQAGGDPRGSTLSDVPRVAVVPPTVVQSLPPPAPMPAPTAFRAAPSANLAQDALAPSFVEFAARDPRVLTEVTQDRSQARAAGRGGGRGGRSGGGAAVAPETPAGPYRWRILSSGAVHRSIGSEPWVPIALEAGAFVTAGDAPAPTVCWLVGRDGLILRSLDATRFDRRPFPERVTLTSIRALDARQASITTSDNRVFVTDDGGATWRPQGSSGAPF